MQKQTIFLLLGCVIAIVAVYALFSTGILSLPQSDTSTVPSNQRLLKNNSAYIAAEQLRKEGKPAEAIPKYQEALSQASPADKGQIDYNIAISKLQSGLRVEGIDHLKRVAAYKGYNNFVRSYAVSAMGNVYYLTPDPEVTKEIFKNDPYASLYVPSDVALSYRHLYEYASSLKPTAISELKIARWYAEEIATLMKSKNNEATIAEYKGIITANLAAADSDFIRISAFDTSNITPVLLSKAIVLSILSLSGDESFGNPETTFDATLSNLEKSPNKNSEFFVVFHKANYLAKKYKSPDTQAITNLLSKIYTNQDVEQFAFYSWIRKESTTATELHKDIVRLGTLDAGFKAFLVSAGWKL